MIFSKQYIIGFVIILVTLFSCREEKVFFEENKAIKNKSWEVENWQEFEFDITDTTKYYNFFFNVRTTANYAYSNMFIYYKLQFPNGKRLTDTAQFILAEKDGKWLGKSISGSLIENSILFSKRKIFPLIGKYKFLVIHGMRTKSLKEVSDVGLKIKESKQK